MLTWYGKFSRTDLYEPAGAVQHEESVEDGVGVMGDPEEPKELLAAEVSVDVDERRLESEQDPSQPCDGLPAPVVELGQHVGSEGRPR